MKSRILNVLLLSVLSACSQAPDTSSQKTAENQVVGENHNANPTQATSAQTADQAQKSDELKKAELADGKKIARAAMVMNSKDFERKNVEWQARAQVATSNAQVQALLYEQRQYFEQIKQQLEKVQLQTVRGKQIHQQALSGLNGVISAYQQLDGYNMDDPSHHAQVENIMKQSVDGMTTFIAAAKEMEKLGLEHHLFSEKQQQKNRESYAKFERSKQDFEASIKAID